MVKVTRLYAAYTLVGGVVARIFINQEIIDFQNDFQTSLVILISFTTIITGLLVLLSLHVKLHYVIFCLYSYIQKEGKIFFKKTETPDLDLVVENLSLRGTIMTVHGILHSISNTPFIGEKNPIFSLFDNVGRSLFS